MNDFPTPPLLLRMKWTFLIAASPWRVSTSDELFAVDVGGIEMEASCSAGVWKLAGAGRAVTGFGPSRLLNGPWGWVMVSLLCARAGVADELAVAHAEAGLEQRVDLGHRDRKSTRL